MLLTARLPIYFTAEAEIFLTQLNCLVLSSTDVFLSTGVLNDKILHEPQLRDIFSRIEVLHLFIYLFIYHTVKKVKKVRYNRGGIIDQRRAT